MTAARLAAGRAKDGRVASFSTVFHRAGIVKPTATQEEIADAVGGGVASGVPAHASGRRAKPPAQAARPARRAGSRTPRGSRQATGLPDVPASWAPHCICSAAERRPFPT